MPDSPIFKKRRLPFRRTAIPFEARGKPRTRWFIQYKRAFGGTQRHFDERGWEPCDLVWAEKCVTHVPAPDGKGILTDSELHRLHWQKRCPCFVKDYGGDLHRWCTWKYHFEGVRVRRGVKGGIDGVDDDGLALWAAGIKQAGITDFFQPTARVGLEENGKESSGTPGGGPTIQTPMGLGLGLPLTSQASGPPRPDRTITAFYSHIKKRQGVGEKAERTWVDASAGEHRA
ncbi:hypothetical protein MMYC01_207572 [Madurella mycetomatis]|uniref:Uncharacterized protein n=1 Tax=Madurella mycetomatis TaxID=100816 RepID=A0A175W2D7_9PEZI|nr:hypothetical protein MMYC01_207572 [Madurella mycetomatis]